MKKMKKESGRKRLGRRGPLATIGLLTVGLALAGGGYAAVAAVSSSGDTSSTTTASADDVTRGQKLFDANCATCHGLNLQGVTEQINGETKVVGPSLVGVGAGDVDFQVSTGRMPGQLEGPQMERKHVQFTEAQIKQLAAYVATKGTGPGIPTFSSANGTDIDAKNSDKVSAGAELFRVNCAMCHNIAGAGGALTDGKYAPDLNETAPAQVYEAMEVGPQNMPVFNDQNITPQQKADIISYLKYMQTNYSPGGINLGSIGPVAEGLFIWVIGIGVVIGFTVWLGSRAN